jgi:hypothetical protein
VYVLTGECSSTAQVTCAAAATSTRRASATVPVVAGTTYTVVVDSFATDSGAYRLYATYATAPSNDTCGTAIDLTSVVPLDGTTTEIVGDTRRAAGDLSSVDHTCQPATSSAAKDVVYTFTAPQTGRYRFTLDSPDWDAVLYATDVTCVTESICKNTPEQLDLDFVAGQTQNVVIDGHAATDAGPFVLDVSFIAPPPNDACERAEVLTVPTDGTTLRVEGDTSGAHNDGQSTTAGCQTNNSAGREVYYVIDAPADGNLVFAFTGFDVSLYTFEACGDRDLLCTSSNALTVPVHAGDQRIIVVDGTSTAASGPFTLSVHYDFPVRGDVCETAIPLPAAGSDSVVLRNFQNDYTGTTFNSGFGGACGDSNSTAGPDAVFTLALDPGQTLTFNAHSNISSDDPVVYLLDRCPVTTSACVAYVDNTASNAGETLTFTNHNSGTEEVFVVVENFGTAPAAGTFALSWTVQ